MDLLCQDGFLYHYCISPFQQFQHLRCAVTLCILSNQEDSPSKWSNCCTKACVPHPLGLYEYIVFFKNKPFSPALVIQAAEDFSLFAMWFKVKMLNFFWKKKLRNVEEFGQLLLLFYSCFATMPQASRPLLFPAREKQKRKRFQWLRGLLGFCSGAVASDGRLPKSRRHCTEKKNGKKELTFRIVQVESVCWSATDINRATLRQTRHPRQAKRRARRSQNTKTFGLQNAGLVCAEFGCLITNYSIRSHMLKSDMTRKASCKRPESRHTRPPALRFHPLGGAKWPNVQLRYCFWLTRSTAVLNRFHTVLPLDLLEKYFTV